MHFFGVSCWLMLPNIEVHIIFTLKQSFYLRFTLNTHSATFSEHIHLFLVCLYQHSTEMKAIDSNFFSIVAFKMPSPSKNFTWVLHPITPHNEINKLVKFGDFPIMGSFAGWPDCRICLLTSIIKILYFQKYI